MRITRILSDEHGVSTLRDVEPDFLDVRPGTQRAMLAEPNIMLRRYQPGVFVDWHNAPEKRCYLIMQGTMEIHTGDGQVIRFHPGDMFLATDVDGAGHQTRIGDDEDCVALVFVYGKGRAKRRV